MKRKMYFLNIKKNHLLHSDGFLGLLVAKTKLHDQLLVVVSLDDGRDFVGELDAGMKKMNKNTL